MHVCYFSGTRVSMLLRASSDTTTSIREICYLFKRAHECDYVDYNNVAAACGRHEHVSFSLYCHEYQ